MSGGRRDSTPWGTDNKPITPIPEGECVHRWLVEAIDKADNPRNGIDGTCTKCGAVRTFPPLTDDRYTARETMRHAVQAPLGRRQPRPLNDGSFEDAA